MTGETPEVRSDKRRKKKKKGESSNSNSNSSVIRVTMVIMVKYYQSAFNSQKEKNYINWQK